jgi:hypothetical protein
VIEENKTCVRFISNLNVLVFGLEVNLTQARFLILYNVVVGSMLVFVVDINLALARFLTVQCFYVLEFELTRNLTHVGFSFTLQFC